MTSSIFQIDWIAVDIDIIILLILLLITVKILKGIYRWRFFFTNTSTIQKRDTFLDIKDRPSTNFIKRCSLTVPNVFQQENIIKPTIIIVRRNRKHMLLKALTEAFSTLGYPVVTIQIRTLTNIRTIKFASEAEKELDHLIPFIIKFYHHDVDIMNKEYNVIDFNQRVLPYDLLLKKSNCKNLILINPLLKSYNLEEMVKLKDDSKKYPQLITIFSEKLNPIFKNKKVNKIVLNNITFTNTKHNIIKNAKSTFKYYETLLLSIIIRYIEK